MYFHLMFAWIPACLWMLLALKTALCRLARWCFLLLLYAQVAPKMSKNRPVDLAMVPKTIKILNFSRKGRFGSVLGRLVIFGRPIWINFRPIWALFSSYFVCFFIDFHAFHRIPENWGGEGGSTVFQITLFSIKTFLQHQNLWLARCGLALQLGYII